MALAIVTGVPGWLGSRLVHALVRGLPDLPELSPGQRRVRCLVLPGADASELEALGPSVEIVRGDVTDPASLTRLFADAGGATVFHSAGLIHPSGGTRAFHAVNTRGTEHMLEASRAARIRRFVHVSSNSPLGTNPTPTAVFDERSPYHPYMEYGRTKMLAEQAVRAAHGDGFETVVIRPPWFYGPGQPPRQTLFFEMIRDGKAPLVGDGTNRRSMAYVDNICQGLLLCEKVDRAAGQVYWIADRRPYAMSEILDTIEAVMERSFGIQCARKRLRLPGFVANIAELVDGMMQRVGLYHQKIHVLGEMNKTIACSVAKAEAELGYDPRVDLEEGMRRSLAWMQERGIKL